MTTGVQVLPDPWAIFRDVMSVELVRRSLERCETFSDLSHDAMVLFALLATLHGRAPVRAVLARLPLGVDLQAAMHELDVHELLTVSWAFTDGVAEPELVLVLKADVELPSSPVAASGAS